MSKPAFLSFYRWAMGLADSEPVRLMHELAREVYRDLGGEAVEEHLAVYAEIVALWRRGGPDRPPLREALRCMGARDRGFVRRDKLREQAWMQARAEVFQQTGERIPLPGSPESQDQQATAEERAMVRQLSQKLRQVSAFAEGIELGKGLGSTAPGTVPAHEPGPTSSAGQRDVERGPGGTETAAPAPANAGPAQGFEPPTNKQIKIGIRRLIDAGQDRNMVKALEAEARSGRVSRAEFVRRVEQLLGVPHMV